jgi:uncharacterized membrane-anchored protein YjiN (DUF445 family)
MLAAVTAVWLLVLLTSPSGSWVGYAQAALEASMVGALADWFAVTALFRHPLGLPIPHTAVVVERKDQFGKTLAEFFRENFLSGEAVAARLRTSGAVERAGTWAADPTNARVLARHLLRHTNDLLDATGDDVARYLVQEVRHLAADTPIAGFGAAALRAMGMSTMLDDAIDAAAAMGRRALTDHRDELESRFARDGRWWLPDVVQRRVFDHLVDRACALLDEVAADRSHPYRASARVQLLDLADRLEHDPALAARLESFKTSLVRDDRVGDAFAAFFGGATLRFHEQVRTPGSRVEQRLVHALQGAAERLRDEPDTRERIERSIEVAVSQATTILDDDIDALVTGTIARWDAARTADQLELLLGPDLQYIRINGTIVGGLAGLLIHAIGRSLS